MKCPMKQGILSRRGRAERDGDELRVLALDGLDAPGPARGAC